MTFKPAILFLQIPLLFNYMRSLITRYMYFMNAGSILSFFLLYHQRLQRDWHMVGPYLVFTGWVNEWMMFGKNKYLSGSHFIHYVNWILYYNYPSTRWLTPADQAPRYTQWTDLVTILIPNFRSITDKLEINVLSRYFMPVWRWIVKTEWFLKVSSIPDFLQPQCPPLSSSSNVLAYLIAKPEQMLHQQKFQVFTKKDYLLKSVVMSHSFKCHFPKPHATVGV